MSSEQKSSDRRTGDEGNRGPAPADINPYSIPETSSGELRSTRRLHQSGRLELASLGARFGGFAIDFGAVLVLYFVMVAMKLVGRGEPQAYREAAFVLGMLTLLYAAVWIYLTAARGQSLGKFIVGTQIVVASGHRAGFARILFLRTLIPLIIPFFPMVSPFFIFGDRRQCLHDMLASTYLVNYRQGNG